MLGDQARDGGFRPVTGEVFEGLDRIRDAHYLMESNGHGGDCVRGLVCNNCNPHGLAWYEALPPELRTLELLNNYLTDPPAMRLRAELVSPVQ
ncbi:hypothetical protein [Streptomyces sp. 2A115]|uniref:hypothetical protein n=1 Tax=Streptomyces sp. 2A115 TaxID=3457439 RepID=UPI003FD3559A